MTGGPSLRALSDEYDHSPSGRLEDDVPGFERSGLTCLGLFLVSGPDHGEMNPVHDVHEHVHLCTVGMQGGWLGRRYKAWVYTFKRVERIW